MPSDHDPSDLPHRLTVLEDLEALRRLKARYAETVDSYVSQPSDEGLAAIVELFAADAVANYGQFGVYEGHEAIAGFFRDVLRSIASWSRHFMHNPILEVRGAQASGRWYATAVAVFRDKPDNGPQVLYVRYEDRYVKTEAGWKFQTILAHFDTPA